MSSGQCPLTTRMLWCPEIKRLSVNSLCSVPTAILMSAHPASRLSFHTVCRIIGLLVDADPLETDHIVGAVQSTASVRQVEIISLKIRTESEIDRAFATLLEMKVDGLVVDGRFRRQIAVRALHQEIPAIARPRDFA